MIFQLLFEMLLEAFESFSGFMQYFFFCFTLRAVLNKDTMNPKLTDNAFSHLGNEV